MGPPTSAASPAGTAQAEFQCQRQTCSRLALCYARRLYPKHQQLADRRGITLLAPHKLGCAAGIRQPCHTASTASGHISKTQLVEAVRRPQPVRFAVHLANEAKQWAGPARVPLLTRPCSTHLVPCTACFRRVQSGLVRNTTPAALGAVNSARFPCTRARPCELSTSLRHRAVGARLVTRGR